MKIGASHREAPTTPRPFPAEFRLRAVALVRAGRTITATAAELGISTGALHHWVRQDQMDRGERPGLTTHESVELAMARKRIRALEAEVEILERAAKRLGEERPGPRGFIR